MIEGSEMDPQEPQPQPKRKPKKAKRERESRGVETMFRTTYRTHLDLSQLADAKANILISLNGIIITVLIATQREAMVVDPLLRLPAAVLMLTSLGSLVLAVLAARPRASSDVLDTGQAQKRRTNLLFFGNFVEMEEDDFVEGIGDLMADPGELYRAMARDIYGLGAVLDRKYRLIRRAYTLFMGGLSVGVVLFVAALLMGGV